MVSSAALISFFSIAGVIAICTATMIWRTHRKNKLFARYDKVDMEGCFVVDEDIAGEGKVHECHAKRWRWKKILYRVGWIRIPSSAKEEPEEPEVRDVSRRGARVDVTGEEATLVVPQHVTDREAGATPRLSAVINFSRLSRPTDVPAFEKVGGYRFGEYRYGPHNLSPLPVVPISPPSPDQSNRPQRLVEVEGSSVRSGSLLDLRMQHLKEGTFGPSDEFPLTTYNGYLTSSQDEMTAALPIPKDHPLHHHHPSDHNSVTYQTSENTEGRNLAARTYERDILVPKPLHLRRLKSRPVAENNSNNDQSQGGSLSSQQDGFTGEDSVQSYRDRRRSRGVSRDESASARNSESRYSHFENPLGKHPVEVEDQRGAVPVAPKPKEIATPWNDQGKWRRAADDDWPTATETKRQHHSVDLSPGGAEIHSVRPQEARRHSLLNERESTLEIEEIKKRSKNLGSGPASSSSPETPEIEANTAIGSSRFAKLQSGTPSVLRIGRRPAVVAPGWHRHCSVVGEKWSTIPLTPAGRSPGNPARWSTED